MFFFCVLPQASASHIHINAQLRTQDAQAQTVEKGERQQRQSEVSAGSQEGECDDGL
jgi:hypothetical protein